MALTAPSVGLGWLLVSGLFGTGFDKHHTTDHTGSHYIHIELYSVLVSWHVGKPSGMSVVGHQEAQELLYCFFPPLPKL